MDELDQLTEDRLTDRDNYMLTHAVDMPELDGFVYIKVKANSLLLKEPWADNFLQASVQEACGCVIDALEDRLVGSSN